MTARKSDGFGSSNIEIGVAFNEQSALAENARRKQRNRLHRKEDREARRAAAQKAKITLAPFPWLTEPAE